VRRLLVFIIVLYVVWRVLIIVGRRIQGKGGARRPFQEGFGSGREREKPGAGRGERLVPCAGCGTMVPESRALGDAEGRFFCSERCRNTASRRETKVAGRGTSAAP